jgi:5-methyltetrahydropteroyltriglutamate--homocysteine methyltransferase
MYCQTYGDVYHYGGQTLMSLRDTPPFRADHVGSLLRPAALLEARAAFADGRLSAEDLRAAEDAAVTAAVRLQEDTGLRSATDGEFRRESWNMDFLFALDGIEKDTVTRTAQFRDARGAMAVKRPALRITGKIGVSGTIFGDHFRFLQQTVRDAVPKISIPSPNMLARQRDQDGSSLGPYSSQQELWADMAAAYQAEVAGLADMGCTYLQLDDTSFSNLMDPSLRERLQASGADLGQELRQRVDRVNTALAGRPAGMTVTTHICRGNYRSRWAAEGGYEAIAEVLFNELDVDGFFLEYDDERSGGFEPLRHVPAGKLVVLGLVTTKRPELEERSALERRLDEASRYISPDQLCLSPQCGFSSTLEGNELTVDDERAKLALIVETADARWG